VASVLSARKLWPDKRGDGSVSVAVGFASSRSDLPGAVDRLLSSWTTDGPPSERALLEDLDQSPWSEQTPDGLEVAFEGRPGNRMWRDWMVSFTSWVDSAGEDVRAVAFVDRVGGSVRPLTSTALGEGE
jgi:hypothetical protein